MNQIPHDPQPSGRFTGEQSAFLCFGIIVAMLVAAALIAQRWDPTGVARSLLELCPSDGQDPTHGRACLAFEKVPTAATIMSLVVWALPTLALVLIGIVLARCSLSDASAGHPMSPDDPQDELAAEQRATTKQVHDVVAECPHIAAGPSQTTRRSDRERQTFTWSNR